MRGKKRFSGYGKMAGSLGFILLVVWMMAGCSGKDEIGEGPAAAENDQNQSTLVRTLHDAMGEQTIPANPERIVVLDNVAFDNLLALHVKPVGAPSIVSQNEGFVSYLKDVEGIEQIGTVEQPNLETIAKLQPDLIIGQKVEHEAIYDNLKKIAPVVFIETVGEMWKDNFRLHADAVGKREEGEKLLADFEKRMAEFQAGLGDRVASTVSLLRPRQDHVRVYLKKSFSGAVIEEAGLKRPAAQQADDPFISVTEEQIADLDGDVIIWFGFENELEFFENKIRSNPVWNTLEAVKNGQVHQVGTETWLSGHGIQAANLMLDDLIEIFNP